MKTMKNNEVNSLLTDYVFEGLETYAMSEITIHKWVKTDPKDIRLILPLTLQIPLANLPPDVRRGDLLEVWSYDPYRGKTMKTTSTTTTWGLKGCRMGRSD